MSDTAPNSEIRLSKYVPHAGQELTQAAIREGRANDDIWLCQTARANVDQAQNKGRQSETAQAERRGIGELAVVGGPVETWLELTTKGWQASRIASVDVRERVPAIVVWLPLSRVVGSVVR